MKIDKLYTLSQFVDYLDKNKQLRNQIELLVSYNNFLKQQLTKDMFVNQFTHPDNMPVKWSQKEGNELYEEQLKQWKEAEKKVIFNNYKIYLDDMYPGCICIINGGCIPFGWKLSKLAEATNGELETKNIEL